MTFRRDCSELVQFLKLSFDRPDFRKSGNPEKCLIISKFRRQSVSIAVNTCLTTFVLVDISLFIKVYTYVALIYLCLFRRVVVD